MNSLDDFPEEILVHIISYLDVEPLSKTKIRHEPHAECFRTIDRPLAHLSTCSRQLRRVILPLLFRHARLNLTYAFQRIQISFLEKQLGEFERRVRGLDYEESKPDPDDYLVALVVEQIVSRFVLTLLDHG